MSAGNPFRHVRSGDKLRIPATVYNAMVDAAKYHKETFETQTADGLALALPFDTLILNDTGADLDRFSVVCLGAPVTLPSDRLGAFTSRQAINGIAPTAAYRGRFAILQEPIRDGAVGRALASGISIARVNVLQPANIDDDWADIDPDGSTAYLTGAASGSARIIWLEPEADRVDPYQDIAWAIVRLGDQGCGGEFSVLVEVDSGAAGSASSTCSWTYTVKTLRGKEIATGVVPDSAWLRIADVEYEETPADTIASAYYDVDGSLILNVPEKILVRDCDADGGPTNAVIIDPDDSADNLIESQDIAATPLTLKGASGQTADLFSIVDSADDPLLTVEDDGVIRAPKGFFWIGNGYINCTCPPGETGGNIDISSGGTTGAGVGGVGGYCQFMGGQAATGDGGTGGGLEAYGGIGGSSTGIGGSGGGLQVRGGDAGSTGHGGAGGTFRSDGGSGSGGTSGAAGGTANLSANANRAGGSLNLSAGASAAGGSINTSNGGGAITTNGSTGSIGLGVSATRTTINGSGSAVTLTCPAATGTLALTVQAASFETTTVGNGFILKSPDGTRWRLTVDNAGVVGATPA